MNICSIPTTELVGLRVVCRNYGIQIVFPLNAKNTPTKCFNCANPIPTDGIRSVLGELQWLNEVNAVVAFNLEFDGVRAGTRI